MDKKKITVKDVYDAWVNWNKRLPDKINIPEWRKSMALLTICWDEIAKENGGQDMALMINHRVINYKTVLGEKARQAFFAFVKFTDDTFTTDES